ncbi:MAG TPA: DUF2190 domain-containing protein [Rubrivivax sp.]|nr:DUF2190 domain-containing protein [Rubrivivax sp.]HRY86987.1 DUF2190 domain-containing protein [Rubrivivax sp.]HRZ59584.1 DUF2190 domain-containing protein [Rubrivivax sp.]
MSNQTLTKNLIAEAGIASYRIVKFGSTDDYVVQGAAVSDLLIGVVETVAPSAGERCDVVMAGIAEVSIGGNVTRGALLTSNGSGQGVAAAPAAGANNSVIGRALMSGQSGDVIPVLLAPGIMQG